MSMLMSMTLDFDARSQWVGKGIASTTKKAISITLATTVDLFHVTLTLKTFIWLDLFSFLFCHKLLRAKYICKILNVFEVVKNEKGEMIVSDQREKKPTGNRRLTLERA